MMGGFSHSGKAKSMRPARSGPPALSAAAEEPCGPNRPPFRAEFLCRRAYGSDQLFEFQIPGLLCY